MRTRQFSAGIFVFLGFFFLLGVPSAFGQSQACSRYPVIFADDGLRGQNLEVSNSIPDLADRGMGDEASSVCVPSGWRIILYSDDRYRGDRLELQGPVFISDLKRDRPQGSNWGDRVSSIEVFRPQPRFGGRLPSFCNQYPILFHDDSFRGGNLQLENSEPDLHRRGMGDGASSVCVPAGWRVVLYEHGRYGGERLEIFGPDAIEDLKRDNPNDQNWGDRISSVEIYPNTGTTPGQPGQPVPPVGLPIPQPTPTPIPAPTPPVQAPGVCRVVAMLYSDSSFRGRMLRVNQSINDLHAQGWGDSASSLCVPENWTLILFSDSGYRGRRLEVRGRAIADLARESGNWGDTVSSIQVIPPGGAAPAPAPTPPPQSSALQVPCDQNPVVYTDDGFRGRSLVISNSLPDLHAMGMGDDVSSLCIPVGWEIYFFEDSNYRGRMLRLGSGSIADLSRARPDGTDWGNRISSLQVRRSQ